MAGSHWVSSGSVGQGLFWHHQPEFLDASHATPILYLFIYIFRPILLVSIAPYHSGIVASNKGAGPTGLVTFFFFFLSFLFCCCVLLCAAPYILSFLAPFTLISFLPSFLPSSLSLWPPYIKDGQVGTTPRSVRNKTKSPSWCPYPYNKLALFMPLAVLFL